MEPISLNISDALMLVAVLLGPILAVQVQKKVESFTQRRERQLFIFRTLMATRANIVSKEHVTALNLIDIDFSEKKKREKPVVKAWRELLDQFGKYPQSNNFTDQNQFLIVLQAAADRAQELLVKLLSEMSTCLGYEFDTIHIRNGCYAPSGHKENDDDLRLIQKGIIGLLRGQIPLSMNIETLPKQDPHPDFAKFLQDSTERQKETLEILQKVTQGNANISVSIEDKTR